MPASGSARGNICLDTLDPSHYTRAALCGVHGRQDLRMETVFIIGFQRWYHEALQPMIPEACIARVTADHPRAVASSLGDQPHAYTPPC